jgi:hypothetical protein
MLAMDKIFNLVLDLGVSAHILRTVVLRFLLGDTQTVINHKRTILRADFLNGWATPTLVDFARTTSRTRTCLTVRARGTEWVIAGSVPAKTFCVPLLLGPFDSRSIKRLSRRLTITSPLCPLRTAHQASTSWVPSTPAC